MLRAGFALLAGGFLVGVAVVACETDDPASTIGLATDAGRDAQRPRDAEVVADAASCAETCRVDFAGGVGKDRAIDACWAASCPVCAGARPGDAGSGTDGGDAAVTCGSTPVVTPLAACDQCTAASCCAPWQACFEDAECRALLDCYGRCPGD